MWVSLFPDLGRRLGSWRLSVALMVLAALYYALLAIWSGSSPPHVVRNITSLLPFWLLYGLLLINTGVCLWQRLPTLRRDIGREPRWSGKAADWTEPADAEQVATILVIFCNVTVLPRAGTPSRRCLFFVAVVHPSSE